MRVTTPTIKQAKAPGRNLRRERRRWDNADTQTLALGCPGCTDFEPCGGLHKKQSHYSCLDDCCGDPTTCDSVCPRNHKGFIERMREINGFSLDNIPKTVPRPAANLPAYVPLIYHRNRREVPFDAPVVALPLHKFYSRRTGKPRYANRAEVEDAFRIGTSTRIILIGSGRDRPIEAWWGLSENRLIVVAALRALGVDLVTSPNYSLFTDEVRYNDLYNIKRIGIAWQEILGGGVPSALHLNARTLRDYERIAAFIADRPEVSEAAFEFGTGANWPQRRDFHIENLAAIPTLVARPLTLVMIGGIPAIPALAPAYAHLTYIDTSAFMTALHRQRLYLGNDGEVRRATERTAPGKPVDSLLVENVEVMRLAIEQRISAARLEAARRNIAQTLETLETEPSAQDAPLSDRAARR